MKQINSIKEKLLLAKKKDQKKTVFGAKRHKYKLKNPLTLDDVILFENEFNLSLPQGYKKMITQLGNEGKSYPNHVVDKSFAGPNYGIYPLRKNNDDLLDNPLQYLSKPFTLKPISEEQWKAIVAAIPDDGEAYCDAINTLYAGILPIGTLGCTGVMGLILNGEEKGKVIYLDQDLSRPIFTNEYFLDWYENWLDEILQNNAFQDKLMQKLSSKDDTEIQKAVKSLHSFKKLRQIDAVLPLLNP